MTYMDYNQLLQQDANGKGRKQYHGANVRFEYVDIPDPKATKEMGRPQFKSVERVFVQYPGGDEKVAEITDRHRAEYATQYAAFKADREQAPDGMPLEQWAAIDKANARNLRAFKIHTVEQLAACTGDVRRKLKHLDKWVKVAQEWMENANCVQADVTKLKRQLTNEKKRTKDLQDKLELAFQRIEALEGHRPGYDSTQ